MHRRTAPALAAATLVAAAAATPALALEPLPPAPGPAAGAWTSEQLDGPALASLVEELDSQATVQKDTYGMLERRAAPFGHPMHPAVDASARAGLDPAAFAGADPRSARALFGAPFAHDADGDGCGADQQVLARDLAGAELGQDGCTVLSGTLTDPYTGRTVEYEEGSGDVVLDHVVPLEYAYLAGATTPAVAAALANDPLNLVATTPEGTRGKTALSGVEPALGWSEKVDGQMRDTAVEPWLPADPAARDAYLARFALVSAKYGLGNAAADGSQTSRLASLPISVDPDSGRLESAPAASAWDVLATQAPQDPAAAAISESDASLSADRAGTDADGSAAREQEQEGAASPALIGAAAALVIAGLGVLAWAAVMVLKRLRGRQEDDAVSGVAQGPGDAHGARSAEQDL